MLFLNKGYHYTSAAFFLLIFCISAGCGEGNSSGTNDESEYEVGANHPVSESIPDDDEVDHVVGPKRKISGNESLNLYADRLRNARLVLELGEQGGDGGEIFGRIEDIAYSKEGHIYVLDSEYGEIRRYTLDGRYKGKFGRIGEGPGEFRDPRSIDITRDDRVIVLDAKGGLELYERNDGNLKSMESLRIPNRAEEMCVLGNKAFVRQYRIGRDTSVVHTYSLQDGSRVQSFGEAYQKGSVTMRTSLSRYGRVGCVDDTESVVTAFVNIPILFGYSPGGDLKWRAKISKFKSQDIIQTRIGSVKWMKLNKGDEYHYMHNVTGIDNGLFVMQKVVATMNGKAERNNKVYTYLFSSITGEGLYVSDRFPLIYSIHNNIILSAINVPFPNIDVYRME